MLAPHSAIRVVTVCVYSLTQLYSEYILHAQNFYLERFIGASIIIKKGEQVSLNDTTTHVYLQVLSSDYVVLLPCLLI